MRSLAFEAAAGLLLLLLVVAAIASGVVATAVVDHHHEPSAFAPGSTIHYLNGTDATAKCLDGSSGAVYVVPSPPGSNHSNDWIFFLQGGGLCVSNWTCIDRSTTPLGSSASYPPQFPTSQLTGILSRDCTFNPEFCEYNIAHVQYCDGFLWSGDRDGAYDADGTPLYFRGNANRRAAIKLLAATYDSFANAKSIMLSGCSAGGMGTLLHSSADAQFLRDTYSGLAATRIKAVPLSGMFLTLPNADWVQVVQPLALGMVPVANATGSFSAECLAQSPPHLRYLCFTALQSFAFSTVPTFVLNSKSDHWQVTCTVLGVKVPGAEQCAGVPRYVEAGCATNRAFDKCTPELMLPILNFQHSFSTHVAASRGFLRPGNGAFISSCFTHCEALGHYWADVRINNVSMSEAVRAWWHDDDVTAPVSKHTLVDCDRTDAAAPFTCNPTCRESSQRDGPIDVKKWW